MRRLARLLAKLYPPRWRARYGEEFDGLVCRRPIGWADLADLVKGAFMMHLRHGTGARVAVGGLAGLALGFALTFALPSRYESFVDLKIWVPGGGAKELDLAIRKAMSLKAMANVIQTQKFFEEEQRTMPLEEVVERLRRRTAIRLNGDGSGRIRIAFESPERVASARLGALARMFAGDEGKSRVLGTGDSAPVRPYRYSLPAVLAAIGVAVSAAAFRRPAAEA